MKQYKFDHNDISFLNGKKIAIVIADYYQDIANQLLVGALQTLKKYGINEQDIAIFYVPGAFEVPLMVQNISNNHYDGIITLGAVIRGETPHFDYICTECTRGVAKVSLASNIPIAFGVLTTDNMAQTQSRAGGKKGNKGIESAMAVIKMMYLLETR